MSIKLAILNLVILILIPAELLPQTQSVFSGEPTKFGSELTVFMGPNLNQEQKINLARFTARWDSAKYSKEIMGRITDISSQLSARKMRAVPHFNDFLHTLNYFLDYRRDDIFFNNWLTGLSELIFSPGFTNDNIDKYFKNTGLMIKDNVLFESGSVKWKVKNNSINFLHDTTFYFAVSDVTLTCYSQKDSTELYDVSGAYYPELQLFRGKKGIVTWEKAGFPRNQVFVELTDFVINTSRNSFTIDSVFLTHKNYFPNPVKGSLSDKAVSFTNKEKANWPQFVTYTKTFTIKNIYEGVNYDGGLTFEGSNVKGTGENYMPASVTLYRHDTLSLKIKSKEFLFLKTGLTSQEASASLYLGKDSIYHTNLGFSYFSATRQVNLFRTNNPVSKSPYFDSFHNLDMYFEYLSWNMNESKITLSRGRGASIGQAEFESSSFFNADYFLQLMGNDNYHPLNGLIKFAEWFYSETFPVPEYAKWLNRPVELVTGLCIDMANRGFVFYDRINNEVTIKKKTKDFLASFAKKKDYDNLNIVSETRAPVDNASLDLKNFMLTVNGVKSVSLSDSQKVAIFPYKQQLIIGKNRDIHFDGIVDAGLFTIYGHNFSFSYDTFKIRLQKIDSIKISVETEKKDRLGNTLISTIDNIIQMGTAQLYIDNPNNKSGLKRLKQYPIINASTYSYIFYDKIAGLEGVYPQKDFYFKIDPFIYENIDHYTSQDIDLSGEFVGGNILKPRKQTLTVQENNSLGFNMVVPSEGIEIYENRARLYNSLNMSNKGLVGGGKMNHLTSVTNSEEYRLYPDSMVTDASSFIMNKDLTGLFPTLKSENVSIKWMTQKDEWLVTNSKEKNFEMFDNGTALDGALNLTPKKMFGSGTINMTNSKVTSRQFSFASNAIKADTADYNLKSTTTSGYSFIAENANTDINFDQKVAKFHLNTDSSVVKFPELQYICTMTDFTYNMETRVLAMEQKGKSNIALLTADKLLKLDLKKLDKPTFFAVNNRSDTVAFSSWKGSYHLDQEYIEAENINYIHIADALIQPANGKLTINRRAKIQTMKNAVIALNNKYILHDASIDIESTKRYSGSAIYDYISEDKEIQQINFPELTVDTLTTSARGFIPVSQNFKFNQAFTFAGDVRLFAKDDFLTFTGAAGIIQKCRDLKSYNIKFKSKIDPKNVMIPVSEKPRDANDNQVFSGSYINTDSIHIYPAFLSAQKSWTDVPIVNSAGYLYYEKAKSRYLIASREKIVDQSLPGDMVSFDKNYCILSGEGKINFGANFDLVKFSSAGRVIHSLDSGKVSINSILALDFHFSQDALKVMADEIRMIPTLKAVNLNSDLTNKGMKDLIGVTAATQLKEEMDLYGSARSLPKELSFELLLNDVTLLWNDATSSFRSAGKIGLGFVGTQAINVYVDGYIEIQRRRSGDLIDIYLKADQTTWYYFSYVRGVMMTQSGNSNYNSIIADTKINLRKDPQSSIKVPYTYMIAVEDRLTRFLRRMTSNEAEEEPVTK